MGVKERLKNFFGKSVGVGSEGEKDRLEYFNRALELRNKSVKPGVNDIDPKNANGDPVSVHVPESWKEEFENGIGRGVYVLCKGRGHIYRVEYFPNAVGRDRVEKIAAGYLGVEVQIVELETVPSQSEVCRCFHSGRRRFMK